MTRRSRTPGVVVRTVPKNGNGPDENEDSAAGDVVSGRFAVSDGASTAARAEVWSKLLTDAFVQGEDPLATDTLSTLRRHWQDRVCTPELAWYAREKVARGSAATFLGVWLDGNAYRMTAVGDSCLLHLSGQELVLVAPLTDWREFSRFPELVHTAPNRPVSPGHVWSGGGRLGDGDVLLLVTDAVAKYLLWQRSETGRLPDILGHLGDDEQFAGFVEQARERGMANDDSTACVVWT
jgi:Protein phosphatase 2C